MCQKPGRSGLDHELISPVTECSSALQQIHCCDCSKRDAAVPLLQLLPASLLPSIRPRDHLDTGSVSGSASRCNGKLLLLGEGMFGFFCLITLLTCDCSVSGFYAPKAPAGPGGRGRKEEAEQDQPLHLQPAATPAKAEHQTANTRKEK